MEQFFSKPMAQIKTGYEESMLAITTDFLLADTFIVPWPESNVWFMVGLFIIIKYYLLLGEGAKVLLGIDGISLDLMKIVKDMLIR